jgi:hypothetical protein
MRILYNTLCHWWWAISSGMHRRSWVMSSSHLTYLTIRYIGINNWRNLKSTILVCTPMASCQYQISWKSVSSNFRVIENTQMDVNGDAIITGKNVTCVTKDNKCNKVIVITILWCHHACKEEHS